MPSKGRQFGMPSKPLEIYMPVGAALLPLPLPPLPGSNKKLIIAVIILLSPIIIWSIIFYLSLRPVSFRGIKTFGKKYRNMLIDRFINKYIMYILYSIMLHIAASLIYFFQIPHMNTIILFFLIILYILTVYLSRITIY